MSNRLSEHMDDALLTLHEVREVTGLSVASIYRWMAAGTFPHSFNPNNNRSVRWSLKAIRNWIQEQHAKANTGNAA